MATGATRIAQTSCVLSIEMKVEKSSCFELNFNQCIIIISRAYDKTLVVVPSAVVVTILVKVDAARFSGTISAAFSTGIAADLTGDNAMTKTSNKLSQ